MVIYTIDVILVDCEVEAKYKDCELFGFSDERKQLPPFFHDSSTTANGEAAKDDRTWFDSQKLNCIETFHPPITLDDPEISTTLVKSSTTE